jgi:hypothetical protein
MFNNLVSRPQKDGIIRGKRRALEVQGEYITKEICPHEGASFHLRRLKAET